MSGAGEGRSLTVHAGCVLVGEVGVLIRGPSGVGKSTLACALVETVERAGDYAVHVADDRVAVSAAHGRLVARPLPAISGRVEVRGLGIVRVRRPAAAAVLRLVVDLSETPPLRWPEPGDLSCEILGIALPRLPAHAPAAVGLVLWRLRGRDDTVMTEP